VIELLITKAELCSLIPHAGSMCLLDGVVRWDAASIVCLSHSHRDPANPLRSHGGRLAALHAFEYGAQAAAVHGGLCARQAGRRDEPGYLAALRDGRLYASYLDDSPGPLAITARQLLANGKSYIYETATRTGDRLLASVRITVMLR
jgi:predicted hotdog family 3-hydroxylacyl-ACP dehydratase